MRPSDFYFQIDIKHECIIIVDKKTWDVEGFWSDSEFGEDIEDNLPEGFFDLTDATYEYDGTLDEAKRKLLSAGFVENYDLIKADTLDEA